MIRLASVRWSHVSTSLLLLYWAALISGTHLPSNAVPQAPVGDKNLHFMAFFGLSVLLAWSWTTRRPFLPAGALFALLVAVVYGAVDEITQAFIPGRFADVADWYNDAAGAVAGTAVFGAFNAVFRRVVRLPM